jgi:hypothetical protein
MCMIQKWESGVDRRKTPDFHFCILYAGGLTVGDWVEVMHDFSPGHNSGGGVGVIIEIVEQFSHVRYIVDSHVEKFVPLTRLTTIPMPYRREKAKLRTRSAQSDKPNKGITN